MASADDFIESLGPDSMRDERHLRAISAAVSRGSLAHDELVSTVRAARTAGDSWTMIAIALGVSRQDAVDRFAPLVDGSPGGAAGSPRGDEAVLRRAYGAWLAAARKDAHGRTGGPQREPERHPRCLVTR